MHLMEFLKKLGMMTGGFLIFYGQVILWITILEMISITCY